MIDDPAAGIETYKKYLAIRNHFKTGYDFFKYGGSVNVKTETYLRRNDKIFFQKIGKQYKGDLTNFFVANFIKGVEYAGDMVGSVGKKNYDEWMKVTESLVYHVSSDIEKILNETDDFTVALKAGYHPLVFKMYLAGKIRVQTITVLNELTGFLDAMESDPITDEHRRFISRLSPFIQFDKVKMAKRLRTLIEG